MEWLILKNNNNMKKIKISLNDGPWKFIGVGGQVRVNIQSGEDIKNLSKLDQKMWSVLSMPVKGLEFDQTTLKYLDSDNDGKIRVDEITAATDWITSVIKNPDILLEGVDSIPLSEINQDTEAGKKLYDTACQILKDLSLKKETIAIADSSTTIDILTQRLLEEKQAAWVKAGEDDKKNIFPYGDNTQAALDAYNAIKDKVEDYFMRCRLAAFNSDAQAPLDVSAAQFEAITTKNLSTNVDEISAYPLARITPVAELPLDKGINPSWASAVAAFKKLVVDVDFPKAKALTAEQWGGYAAKFTPYITYMASKDDKTVELPAAEILEVDKMLHYVRYIYPLLKNYVTFIDFYSPTQDVKSIFQAGTLYIDQRSCSLCVKVSDMGKQGAQAGASGMYLIYCDCTSKTKAETMTIVAVMTDGDIDNLAVGKNAIFYDRDGNDWDAVVTKIIENPISIRQAFWSPYRRFARFIEEQINKFAADRDSKVTSDATSKIGDAGTQMTTQPADGAAPAAKPQPFDIAKFCGIFAAIGMAIGYIGGFLVSVLSGFVSLTWWQMILSILGVMLLISGPSMIMAALKLRKRNLAPVLNANGWAVNASVIVNIPFGNTLTQMAKFPLVAPGDAFKPKKNNTWWEVLLSVLVVAAIILFVLYYFGFLTDWGVNYHFLKPLKFWA